MTAIRIKFLDQKCEKRISGWDVTVGIKKASMVHQPHRIDLLMGLHYNQQDKNPARGISKAKPKNNLKEGFAFLSHQHLKRDWQSLGFMCPKGRDLSYSHLLAFLGLLKKDVSQMKAITTSNNTQQNHTFIGNADYQSCHTRNEICWIILLRIEPICWYLWIILLQRTRCQLLPW